MNIAVVGLGVIGGSLAKAFTKYTDHFVMGINRTEETAAQALKDGAIHKIASKEDLKDADIVFMCTYPHHIARYVEENGEYFKKGCIVTDVCGIKTEICNILPDICRRFGLEFIGSHPMAGKEQFTYTASEAELFKGASYIIVPCGASETSVETIKNIAMQLGFGMTCVTTAEEHDRMIAFTSQIPHVLACSYVLSPCCPKHVGFSAGSYRDVSRVANINETLWTDLFLSNRKPLITELNVLIDNLTLMRNAIDENDPDKLRELLKASRLIKEGLGEGV